MFNNWLCKKYYCLTVWKQAGSKTFDREKNVLATIVKTAAVFTRSLNLVSVHLSLPTVFIMSWKYQCLLGILTFFINMYAVRERRTLVSTNISLLIIWNALNRFHIVNIFTCLLFIKQYYKSVPICFLQSPSIAAGSSWLIRTFCRVVCSISTEQIYFRDISVIALKACTNQRIPLPTFRNRQIGKTALWNPGCDHAGIATQVFQWKEFWIFDVFSAVCHLHQIQELVGWRTVNCPL